MGGEERNRKEGKESEMQLHFLKDFSSCQEWFVYFSDNPLNNQVS